MSKNLDHLRGNEVDDALGATVWLLEHKDLLGLSAALTGQLTLLRVNLREEQDERRAIAQGKS